jgi:hypothetical protein
MFTGYFIEAIKAVRSLKVPLLVVALSALVALLFSIATRPAAPRPPDAAGEAQIRLMRDEHLLVADFVRNSVEAERVAAARDRAEMHAVAAAGQSARVVAFAVPLPKPSRAVRIGEVTPAKTVPAAGPPLQLQSVAIVPPPRPVPVAAAGTVIATVERIPGWVGAGMKTVADWAIAQPAQAIARLPERRFL